MVCPSSLSYAQNTTPCLYVERLNPVAIYLLFTFRNHTTLPTAQVSCKSWAPIGLLAYQKIPILQKMYHSLTHCCAWPAESRSDLHNERSWLVIWARPTDIPQSSSTCCSHVLLGRPGGRFQSAAGGVSVTQCGYHQLTVALAARQVDKRDQTTNDVCQRWETVDQVTSFSPGLQHLTPCHFMPRIQRSACIWRDWMNPVVIYFTHCPRFEDIQHNWLYKWAVNPELDG